MLFRFSSLMVLVIGLFGPAQPLAAERPLIKIGLSRGGEPYVIQPAHDSDPLSGFDPELARTVFDRIGYDVQFIVVDAVRLRRLYASQVEAAILAFNPTGEAYMSEPIRYWNNCIMHLVGDDIPAVSETRVAAFFGAKDIHGPQIAKTGFSVSSEHYVQYTTDAIARLLKGRVSHYLGDLPNFIQLYRKKYAELSTRYQGYEERPRLTVDVCFEPRPHMIAFKNSSLGARFDKALRDFKETADYVQLYDRFIEFED